MHHSNESRSSTAAINRRGFLASAAALASAGALAAPAPAQAPAAAAPPAGPHKLPAIPYAYGALEPVIDTATMTIHHAKHHQTYIDKLNAALVGHPDLAAKTAEELVAMLDAVPEGIRGAVRNHGGGHANHALFWRTLCPPSQSAAPTGKLATAIDGAFGGFANFQTKLTEAALGQFGSGWAWLVASAGKLEVMATPNQDSPLSVGKTPLVGIDVWEHAYYLKHQNRRPDYVAAWWGVVNWEEVAKNLDAA
ncbi:MAG: superoxide dismutase [Lacipirellulaceae bacterium]